MRIPYLPDSDDSPPDFSKPIPPLDPEEIKRFKERKEREEREEREKQEARARARAAADARNRAAMEEQRRAGPHPDVIRHVEEARARAARKDADDDTTATPDRKRKGRKRRRRAAATVQPALPTERELLSAMKTAETSEDVLAAVSRWCWAQTNSGTVCPPSRMASVESLTAELKAIKKQDPAAIGFRLPGFDSGFWTELDNDPPLEAVLVPPKRTDPLDGDPTGNSGLRIMAPVDAVHKRWLKARQREPDLPHPLARVVAALQQRTPEPVKMANKPCPIMPRAVAHVETNAEHYYLARFGSAVHREPDGQLLMGFATEGERGPTLPANVWAMGLAAAERRGAVVPLALRIWVAAILHTPLVARHGHYPVELTDLTLRRFLAWVYTSKKVPKPVRYWPRIMAARDVINATELPFEWRGNLWARPVVTLATPLTRPSLDDPWPVTVHLPPSDGTGPAIDFTRLQYWSVRNAACYRAMINLAYRWHIEGKRLMPAASTKHWLQIRDPKRYDRITDAAADALCYPPGTGAKRRDQRIADAYTALEELVKEGDAVTVDGRLLPPPRQGAHRYVEVHTGT